MRSSLIMSQQSERTMLDPVNMSCQVNLTKQNENENQVRLKWK